MNTDWTPVPVLADEPAGWKPRWVPKVGERVRVRLSGECQRPRHPKSTAVQVLGITEGHPAAMDGLLGTVTNYRPTFAEDTHPYSVWFAVPLEINGLQVVADSFAAIELDPLDWPAQP